MAASDRHSRTEPATPKKKQKARQEGQVPRSVDLSGWIQLLAGSFLLPWLISTAETRVVGLVGGAMNVISNPTPQAAMSLLDTGLVAAVSVIVPVAGGMALLGAATNIAEIGPGLSWKAARPKLSRVSPKAGFSRLFSPQSGINLGRQLLKLACLAGIAVSALTGLIHTLPATVPVGLMTSVGLTGADLLRFVRSVAAIGVAIGLADYLITKKRLNTSLKMTKQEVKDEMRDREGNPEVKGELRRRSYQIARSRMIQAVRSADVLVANPTHVAVALRYDTSRSGAPVVAAKGVDDLAQRMKAEAATCAVPVVEDPPLARALYAICDVGDIIPPALYFAVARLLAFVYSLPPQLRAVGAKNFTPSEVADDPGPDFLDGPIFGSRKRQKELVTT